MKITEVVANKLKKYNDYGWSVKTMAQMTRLSVQAIRTWFKSQNIEIKHKKVMITMRDCKNFKDYDADLSFNGRKIIK